MRYLITGIHGMAGSHLAEYLIREKSGFVAGVSRTKAPKNTDLPIRIFVFDLRDYQQVKHCLADFRPDAIFHLAAQTFVPESWNDPQDTFINNTISEMNLFEAVLELKLDPIIHVASSGVVYGNVAEIGLPLREEHTFQPANPYALSKVAQEYITKQYESSHQVKTIITRTFNHTGPRRGEQYVESSFAKQLVEIELGLRNSEIFVGNLSARRDFLDVRDVVRAYSDVVHAGLVGQTFQICSGVPISIEELLDKLISLTALSVKVTQEPDRLRHVDTPVLYGDPHKLQQAIQWRPKYTLEQTLQDLLNYWRDRLRSEALTQRA